MVDAERLPESAEHPWVSVKDPSIVRFGGKWHLFCTLRKLKEGDGRIRIGYLSFENWEDAQQQDWSVLTLTMSYHGAPQIFWFEPHQKWYLIYQAADDKRGLKYGPCFSTNDRIDEPAGWTLPEPLYVVEDGMKAGLDFWVICDASTAYLFFTTNNGQMWRSQTPLESFPSKGWSRPEVALKADIFEASHTYRIRGTSKYITLIEAMGENRRYFKAYVADALGEEWQPLAASKEQPFVSPRNVVNQDMSWATSYSHGEFIRHGHDQHLELDPESVRVLFQGVNDQEYRDKPYGNIPWRLGILEMVH
ncbi:MAG: hypothetical protein KDA88_21290 [Planctomycetaceae bacterium]|nr:hypothetical protein [Planctomycetaceae bacterium]MCB9950554.1 glycoside hydrolase [Planctomycetaceae bacterium]